MKRQSTPRRGSEGKADGTGLEAPARRAIAYRSAFLDAIGPDDVRAIGAALLERAKSGDPAAARLVLDRVLGAAAVPDWPSAEKVERDLWISEL